MRAPIAIALLLLGLILFGVGIQNATWNTVTGSYSWSFGFYNPVAAVAGVVAFAAGIWLLTRRPRTDRDDMR